jgi:predicted amino acid-binding ACT domain protein
MSIQIRPIDYFYTTAKDQPGEAYRLLSLLAGLGVNLVSFTAIPISPTRTQLTLFPEDTERLCCEAGKAGVDLDGPYPAILVQGDDELGALAEIHQRLFEVGVNVFASTGVSDGRGAFGYVVYVRPEDHDAALRTLGL